MTDYDNADPEEQARWLREEAEPYPAPAPVHRLNYSTIFCAALFALWMLTKIFK